MSLSTKAYKVTITHPTWPGRREAFHFHDLDAPQRFMRFWIGIGGDADFEHVLHLPPPEPWPGPPPVADGGPAFGMSLRDYFAGQAARQAAEVVCDMLNEEAHGDPQLEADRHARAAYMVAAAMLKAREQS